MTTDEAAIEAALRTARRRAQELVPSSPSWDAAMAAVDDLEQAQLAWREETVASRVLVSA